MKEFEKWYKECDYPGDCMSEMAEYAWRAALELVLNMFGANTFHGCSPINIEKALK